MFVSGEAGRSYAKLLWFSSYPSGFADLRTQRLLRKSARGRARDDPIFAFVVLERASSGCQLPEGKN